MEVVSARSVDACRPLIGFEVLDGSNQSAGTLFSLWYYRGADAVQFFGVQTLQLAGKGAVVPAEGVEVDALQRRVHLPYPRALIDEAPAYSGGAELTPEQERDIYLHYGLQVTVYPRAGTDGRQGTNRRKRRRSERRENAKKLVTPALERERRVKGAEH